ncbi:MAG: dTDP-4-dehydrorhamnose 3,5-epimerase [Patescibacteria group bacterium]|jgi:dTDP-4-dehydrorhamnose 3,5-epimerase
MNIIPTKIPDVKIIELDVFGDERGFFCETFNEEKFASAGLPTDWKQDNHSASVKGVLRGLHFQLLPKPMAKLVRCTKGKVFDVAVDLRKSSPTYLQWVGVELSAENKKMLLIPEGFAHGFYTLEDCDFLYKCSNVYVKELDANVRFDDPAFGVAWPLQGAPVLSNRDAAAPAFSELDLPF